MSERRRLRVLQIVGTDAGGSWFCDQVAGLQARGHDVCAVVPREGQLVERLRARQVRTEVIDFKGSSLASLPRTAWALLRLVVLMLRFRPQVTHCHLLKAILVGRVCAALARVPVRVSQVPGVVHLTHPVFRALDRLTLPLDSMVIASCTAFAGDYVRLGARRVGVSHYGCRVHEVRPRRAREEVRRELGVPESAPVVAMVAHMYPTGLAAYRDVGVKGHETFLDAAAALLAQRPDTFFLVVGDEFAGDGSYRAALERRALRAPQPGQILFLGHREDVADLMAAADVVVNPSLSESASYTMIEALLLERGVVATDVGGLPDTIQDRETGLLVPPADPGRLADAIARLLDDPSLRATMGALGRERCLVRFDIERTVAEVEDIYDRLLTAGAGR